MDISLSLRMRVYISILFCVVVLGTLGIIVTEQIPPFDALYFVIVTIATVGYGDIHPLTPAGRALSILIILTGVGCFIGVAAYSVESMIDERERKIRIEKLNMIIGIFYSEFGTKVLTMLSACDPRIDEIRSALVISDRWSDTDFARTRSVIGNHTCAIDSRSVPLDELYRFLMDQKQFLLVIIENPLLIEHDTFIPLLQAIYHLAEEMMARQRFSGLPESDYAHISGDINRMYRLLMIEWLAYMQHLMHNYPYLFSLAMRRNPFDRDASVIVT